MLPETKNCKDEELKIAKDCQTLAGNIKGLAEYVADNMLHLYSRQIFTEQKPEVVEKYDSWGVIERTEWDKKHPTWRKDCGFDKWLDRKAAIENENQSHIDFLTECCTCLDGVRLSKVQDRILMIKGINKEFNKIAKQFGGEVVGWDD